MCVWVQERLSRINENEGDDEVENEDDDESDLAFGLQLERFLEEESDDEITFTVLDKMPLTSPPPDGVTCGDKPSGAEDEEDVVVEETSNLSNVSECNNVFSSPPPKSTPQTNVEVDSTTIVVMSVPTKPHNDDPFLSTPVLATSSPLISSAKQNLESVGVLSVSSSVHAPVETIMNSESEVAIMSGIMVSNHFTNFFSENDKELITTCGRVNDLLFKFSTEKKRRMEIYTFEKRKRTEFNMSVKF